MKNKIYIAKITPQTADAPIKAMGCRFLTLGMIFVNIHKITAKIKPFQLKPASDTVSPINMFE